LWIQYSQIADKVGLLVIVRLNPYICAESRLTEQAKLFDVLDQLTVPVQRTYTETMEQLDQDYGFILYTTRIIGQLSSRKLAIQDVRDRALVYLDGVFQGIVERNSNNVTPLRPGLQFLYD
jgi:beta-galactosidase